MIAAKGAPAGYALDYSESREEGAKLTYGRDSTDDLAFMLQCRPGSGRIEIIELDGDERAGTMVLTSGPTRSSVRTRIETTDGPGDYQINAAIDASNPVMAQFRATGRLRLSGPGFSHDVSAGTSAQKTAVTRFFGACRKD
jgi:hypothetical protein